VVSVALNGRRLDEADLNASLERSVEADVQVDLESAERRTLVRDVLRGLGRSFATSSRGLPHGRSAGRRGGQRGNPRGGRPVTLWQTAYRAIGQCGALLGEDLTSWSAGGDPLRGTCSGWSINC